MNISVRVTARMIKTIFVYPKKSESSLSSAIFLNVQKQCNEKQLNIYFFINKNAVNLKGLLQSEPNNNSNNKDK